ncbi:MAG: hypothetical protein IKS16_01655 [Lachnospiraceae bacterium]|nr:hypothetical protein [Lachnospiraceae bacterium]
MKWDAGYQADYCVKIVDPASWRDLDTYNLTGGSISKSEGSLQETASLNMTEIPEGPEIWIRVYLTAKQALDGDRQALFTGVMSAPATNWNGTFDTYTCECYSVLKPASDVLLRRGWYSPAGISGAAIAAQLLAAGPAPVETADASPLLAASIIAEDGETNLTMAEKILEAINWRIRVSGNGVISVEPKETEARLTIDTQEHDIVELQITDTKDLFKCPNVFRATADDLTAIAKDDNPDSILSTVSRGREVWMEETSCTLSENESIAQYALRRLKEEQTPSRKVNYTRRFWPDLTIGDIVMLNMPAQGISGEFRIKTQQIELGYGARTTEEAEEV